MTGIIQDKCHYIVEINALCDCNLQHQGTVLGKSNFLSCWLAHPVLVCRWVTVYSPLWYTAQLCFNRESVFPGSPPPKSSALQLGRSFTLDGTTITILFLLMILELYWTTNCHENIMAVWCACRFFVKHLENHTFLTTYSNQSRCWWSPNWCSKTTSLLACLLSNLQAPQAQPCPLLISLPDPTTSLFHFAAFGLACPRPNW